MVMGEEISRLMDGEIGDEDFEAAYFRVKQPTGMGEWACYHLIGDALRDSGRGYGHLGDGFSKRFAARLGAEATVLAPKPKHNRPLAFAWAAAAGVAAVALVGWVAFGTMESPPAAMAKAEEAATVRAAAIRPQTPVPADYLLAHQEYSPTTQIPGVGPYLRSVSVPGPDARP
jgi:sigma-E factor negative regulatory protein RseA